MGSRALALDSAGRPAIAYGEDAAYYARYDGATWQIETVDPFWGYLGLWHSLALDAGDRPHISYYDVTNGDLKYAHFDGTAWQTRTVDSPGNVGGISSLALDSADRPHLAYYDATNGDLKYARFDGSAWHTATVDSADDVGSSLSLDIDQLDRPHIAYRNATNGDLKYAWYDGATWHIQVVDSVGTGISLAMDQQNHPHISYRSYSAAHDLKYAYYDGAAWQIETVHSDDWASLGGPSLALDASGQPHISYEYFYKSTTAILYAYHDDGGWHVQAVQSSGGIWYYPSLALDAAGRPHIGYYNYAHEELKYAYYDGVAWQFSIADQYGTAGRSTSLALDRTGHPHVSYQADGRSGYHVKYAQDDGVGWRTETVDSSGIRFTSLALDAADRPHVSYYAGNLKYAWWDGSSWISETVDSAGYVGSGNSLALDAAGRPHISYYDYTNGDLKYALHDGQGWQIETVDSAGDVGRYTSLALDAAGRPHISYYDDTNGDLKYAHFDGSFSETASSDPGQAQGWQIETVDSTGHVGWNTSLALDAAGRPHISYCLYDPDYMVCDDLKYAYLDGTSWISETVDSAGRVGRHTSLALDAAGRPHISYYDYTNGDLKYALYDGQGWQIETVEGQAVVGGDTSLALDVYGLPHITYFDYTNWDLKYAYKACTQVSAVRVQGPQALLVGQEGTYGAIMEPITATLPITFTWDNGTVGPTATYSWSLTGTYTLTVTATNVCGGAQVASWQVRVLESWPYSSSLPLVFKDYLSGSCWPVEGAAFSWEPLTPTAGGVVTFTGQAYGTWPIDYTWDLGDGATATGRVVTHTYAADGSYVVTMAAANTCGQETVSDTVTVLPPCDPVHDADFAWVPLTPTAGEVVTLTGSASGSLPIAFDWAFGDGASGSGASVTHAFSAAGSYTVTMTATNACGYGSVAHPIIVVPACDPVHDVGFSWVPLTPTAGEVVTFTGSASGTPPISYTWEMGDGFLAEGQQISHIYVVTGSYWVVMTATNCGTATATITQTVVVVPACEPVHNADFTWTPLTPTVGGGVTFTSSAGGTAPISFEWSFGDGNSGMGQVVTHTYALSGIFGVMMVATNMCGQEVVTHSVIVDGWPGSAYEVVAYPAPGNPNQGDSPQLSSPPKGGGDTSHRPSGASSFGWL